MAPNTRKSTAKKSAPAPAADAAALDKENAELKRKLREMEEEKKAASRPAKSPKSGPGHPKTNTIVGAKVMSKGEITTEETSSITKAINFCVFCSTIFLPAGGEIWKKVMRKIYDALDPKPSPSQEAVDQWIHSRGNVCGSIYNATRTYINGQQKTAIYNYANLHDGNFPSLEKIESIADRRIKIDFKEGEEDNPEIQREVQENIDLFVWYWEDLIGRCCPANTKFWEDNVKFYTLLSDKKSPITPQMEAFTVVNLHNNYSYWKKRYDLEQERPGHRIAKKPKLFQLPPLGEGEQEKGWRLVTITSKTGRRERVIYYYGKEWDTKYSKSDAGSSITGGYTSEGKKEFVSWVGKVQKARKTKGTRAVEQKIVAALRENYGIEGDNAQEESFARRSEQRAQQENIDWGDAIALDESYSEDDSNGSAPDDDEEAAPREAV